jgi:hypothetical protein
MLMALHEKTHSRAPFDRNPVVGGNVEIRRDTEPGNFRRMILLYRIVPKAELAADPGRLRYQSHYASCTDPTRFRRG